MNDFDEVLESGDIDAIEKLLKSQDGEQDSTEEKADKVEAQAEPESETEEPAQEAASEPAAEPESATPSATEETVKPEVILSENGQHAIPMRVLQEKRKEAQRLLKENQEKDQKIAEFESLVEKLKRAGVDIENIQDPAELTEEEIAELKEDALGRAQLANNERIKRMEQQLAERQAVPVPDSDPVGEIVRNDPLLSKWVNDPDKLAVAEYFEDLVLADEKFSDATLADKYKEVVRRSLDYFGETKAEVEPKKPEVDTAAIAKAKVAEAELNHIPTSLTSAGATPSVEVSLEDRLNSLDGFELTEAIAKLSPSQLAQIGL